ncbi:portal protein [Salmonella enterica subsp. enterica serovar Hadar]|nr:portal protein [Salmonella enterica subsp. enterica serovar Hadar]EBG6877814.1 portal protein [Salmonella enterica subsp. enterica]EBO3013687.1 portal protein [Salmonella enterica subsp. enterica serovar Newport]HAF4868140.1 portal protein [Salmonella enterica]EAC1152079.1 portal protein [Salmonella enterica subsp. enterica serovar Hadar]
MADDRKMTDWHRKVLCNFDNAWSETQDMREQIIEAQRFVRVSGAQWEGSTNAGYSFDEGRFEHYPRFELNKIARECDRIIGEYRQNRISVKFRPKDDKASEALAEKMNGKFRADYQETSGGEACDNAFDDAVTGGFGCFRMCADYEDEMDPSNEQRRISLLPVYDPATCVFFDQDSKQYDRSDAMWAMEMFSMTPKAFEAEYPDSIAASLSRDDTGTQYDWSTPDAIYVGRYYEVRIEKVKLTAWRNPVSGETAIYDEEQIKDIVDELTDGAFELIGERTVKKRRVYCGLLSGAEWLEEPKRIPGEHIPLIPVYGRRSFVDNQERIEGHAAKAMDAQRLENLMVSMIADNATQAGGDGIPVVDVDMIPGPLATHWAERNKNRPAFLPMVSLKNKNGDITAQAQVSSYTPPTQMPPALAGLLQYTGTAIQQITGASQLENMPSNVATDTVDSIFNRMDTQSYIYMDNMAKSMRRAGVVWLSMAREVYGSDTPMRIVNEDGSDDVALMTGEVVDRQTGQVIALNDLSQGNYEVTVDVGQSFATRRDATVKSLLSMLALIPPGTPKHDLVSSMILDNMDGEGMDDLKEYNRNQLLLSGVIKPRTPEEQQMVEQAKQQQASQPDPAMVAAQGQLLAGQAELQKAQNEQAAIQVKAFQAQTDAQVAAANVVKILASADSQQKSDIREALKLLGQFQQQQGDNARADAELVLKSQAQGHAQRMDISSILQKSTQQQPQQ